MTIPGYGLLDDRVFGGRKSPNNNPFDWRNSRSTMPAVVTTAKRPSWQDYKSGAVDAARDRAGLGLRMPTPQQVGQQIADNFRTAYAQSPRTQRLTKIAAQADLGIAGALSAIDPQITGQGAQETLSKYAQMTGGKELSTAEAMLPLLGGGFVGNAVAVATGARLATRGIGALGRATGSTRLVNFAANADRMRQGTFGQRALAEIAPVVPVNIAQGLADEEGGELTAMASEKFGTGEWAKRIRSMTPTQRRLAGVLENQALDLFGFGALESLPLTARIGRGLNREIVRPIAETEEMSQVTRRLGEVVQQAIASRTGQSTTGAIRSAGRSVAQSVNPSDAAGAAVGGGAGALLGEDENSGLYGAVLGAAGARAARGAGNVGLSTVRVPDIARVDAPFPAYSQVLKVVSNSKQEKGGLDHWRGILTGEKSGIRPAELEQTGVLDWIASQKEPRIIGGREVMMQRSVTKQEIMDYHRSKLPELGTADRGVEAPRTDAKELTARAAEYRLDAARMEEKATEAAEEFKRVKAQLREIGFDGDPRLVEELRDQEVRLLRDIDNYREYAAGSIARASADEAAASQKVKTPARWGDYAITNRLPKDDAELVTTFDPSGDEVYSNSTHWGNTKNPLAHTRLRRAEIDGERALVVTESQSDIQQAARKYGVRTPETKREMERLRREFHEFENSPPEEMVNAKIREVLADSGAIEDALSDTVLGQRLFQEYRARHPDEPKFQQLKKKLDEEGFDADVALVAQQTSSYIRYDTKREIIDAYRRGEIDLTDIAREVALPRARDDWYDSPQVESARRRFYDASDRMAQSVAKAPFPKTEDWTRLNIRRMLALAAEEGRDLLVLPTGEQVADMFSLTRQVDSLDYDPKTKTLRGYMNGSEVYKKDDLAPGGLGEYVGEEVAKKLRSGGRLSGDDIKGAEKIGASKMQAYYEGFYQRELKSVLKSLGQDAEIAPLKAAIRIESPEEIAEAQKFVEEWVGDIDLGVAEGVRRVSVWFGDEARVAALNGDDWFQSNLLAQIDEQIEEYVASVRSDIGRTIEQAKRRAVTGGDNHLLGHEVVAALDTRAKEMRNRINQFDQMRSRLERQGKLSNAQDFDYDRRAYLLKEIRDAVIEGRNELSALLPPKAKSGGSTLQNNPALRLSPETLALLREGQPLYAAAGLSLESIGGQDDPQRDRVTPLLALAAGAIVGKNLRGAKLIESTLASRLGTISQEAQSYGRYGFMRLPPNVEITADQLRVLNEDVAQSLIGDNGEDLVGQLVEAVLQRKGGRSTKVTPATGVWEGSFSPNRLIEVEGDDEAVRLRAAIHGLVEGQDAVAWHRYLGGKGGSNDQFGVVVTSQQFGGVDTATVKALLSQYEDPRFKDVLSGATEQGGHILFRNFGGLKPEAFSGLIRQAAEAAGLPVEIHTGYFAGELLSGTGAYLRAVGRQPDTLREVRSLLSRVQPAYERFAQQVGGDLSIVRERFAARARGLEALEGRLRNPPPKGGDGKLTVPVAAESVAADVRKNYGESLPESLPPRQLAEALEGRLRVEIQQLAHDLGLTRQEIEDWYAGGSRLLRDQLTLGLPTLADDDMWVIFTAASSALSSGQKVNDEIRSAANIWAQVERTLAADTPSWKGLSILDVDGRSYGKKKAAPALFRRTKGNRGFIGQRALGIGMPSGGYEPVALSQRTLNHEAFLADLRASLEANGPAAVARQLRDGELKIGMRNVKDERGKPIKDPVTGKNLQEPTRVEPVAISAIGPKTGQYFLDKLGLGGSGSTIDLWMARLYHILRGDAPTRIVTEDDLLKARKRLDDAEKLELDDEEIEELDALIKGGVGKATIDDSVTPYMREVMQEVLRGIARDFDAAPSSAQALAWYAVKRMFARAGAREDPNAYATLASGAADFLSTPRTPALAKGAKTLDDPIRMGASAGKEQGWNPAITRAKTFSNVGLEVPPQSAAVVAPLAVVAGEPTEEEINKASIATGMLAGLAVITGAGRAVFRRLPGILNGQRRATLASGSPAAAAVMRTIATGSRKLPKSEGFLGTAERLYASLVDEVYAARKLGRRVNNEAPLTGLDAQLRQSERWVTWSAQMLRDQLAPVLRMARGREGDVMALAKAERDLQLRAQGAANKSDLDVATLQQAVQDLSADPETLAATRALQDYYRELVEIRHTEGLIDDDQYLAIVSSEDFYTPFVREWEREGVRAGSPSGPMPGGKAFNSSTGVRRLNREQQARALTVDPFEMAIMDTQHTWRQVARQRVWNMVAQMVEANGGEIPGLIRRLPSRTDGHPTNRLLEAIVQGRRVAYDVMDTDLMKALSSFSPQSDVPQLLRMVKEFKRAAITTFPDFAIRNLLRDNAQVTLGNPGDWRRIAMSTGGGAIIGGGTPLVGDEQRDWGHVATRALIGAGLGSGASTLLPQLARTMRGVTDIMAASNNPILRTMGDRVGGDAAAWNQFLTDGGASIGHYSRDLKSARETLVQLRGPSVATRILSPKSWWETLEAFGSALENAPRLATYKSAIGGGAGRPEAAARAADVSLDFSRKGGAQLQKFLTGTTAFYNARVQGWDKVARMVREPKTWGIGFAALTAPSIANWLAIHENAESREAYYEHPGWVRNTFWLVPTGGEDFLYIPKPFELGMIFASVPERALDWWYTTNRRGDAQPMESATGTAKEILSQTLGAELPLTDIAKPMLEQSLNYDMFRNRPIVSSETFSTGQKLAPEQVNDRTSKVARQLGEKFNLSPERLDHLISAYGGTGARMAVRVADKMLPGETPGDIRQPAIPVVGDMAAGFTDRKGTMSDDEVTLARRWDVLKRTDNSLRALTKTLESESASDEQKRMAASRIMDIKSTQTRLTGDKGEHLDGVKASMALVTDIRQAGQAIARDTRLSTDERRQRMATLQSLRARVARAAVAGRYDEVESIATIVREMQL